MKHFKKSLVALLIFAMLLAAIVVTVIAADDAATPVGSMIDARDLLDAAIAEEDVARKSAALGAFYKYTVTNPIPPSDEYSAIIEEYEKLSLDVAKQLLLAVDADGNNDGKKSSLLGAVWSHLNRAPINNPSLAGYAEFAKSYSEKAFAVATAFYAACESGEINISKVYAHISSVRIVDYVVDAENNTTFKATATYKSFVQNYNTKALAELNAELDKYATAENKAKVLSTVYEAYVAAPPVDVSTCYDENAYKAFKDAWNAFIAKYDAAVVAELNGYVAAVGSAQSLEDKSNNVYSAIAFLGDSPVLNTEGDAYKAAYAAYNVAMFDVAKLHYNELLDEKEALDAAISAYVSYLASSPTIIYKEPTLPEYSGDIAKAIELINAYKAEGADKLATFAALYAYMVSTPVDPESGEAVKDADGKPVDASGAILPEGATDFYLQGEMVWNEFSKAAAEVYAIIDAELSSLDASASMDAPAAQEGEAAPQLSPFAEDVATIAKIAKYFDSTPFSRELIEKYNAELHAFTVRLKSILDEKYTAYAELEAVLNTYLGKIVIDSLVLPKEENAANSYATYQYNVSALSAYKHRKGIADKIFASEEKKYDMVEALIDLINAPLIEYEAPKTPEYYSGDIAVVQSLIVQYRSTTDRLERNRIYAAIYSYLESTPVNPLIDGYSAFSNAYAVAGEEVYLAFVSYIDEATEYDDKAARIDEMFDYLTTYPISNAAYNAYNVKLLTVYQQAAEACYAEYKTVTADLHALMEDGEVLAAIGGNIVIPDDSEEGDEIDDPSLMADSNTEISGFVIAIDNIELVETYALALSYNMVYLQDNPTENYVAMISRGMAIKSLNSYVRKYSVSSTVLGYAAYNAEITKAKADYDIAVAEAKARLDAEAPLTDDELNNGFTYVEDFSDDTFKNTSFAHFDKTTGKNTGTDYFFIDREDGNGKALEIVYGHDSDQGTSPTSGYFEPGKLNSLSGLVMEFDVSAKDELTYLSFSSTENGLLTNARVGTSLFAFDKNKLYYWDNDTTKVLALDGRELIVPGEWTHVIYIYDPDGPKAKLYIDYEFVAEFGVQNSEEPYVFTALRIQCSTKDVSARLDDLDFYQGTAYRDRQRFDGMTDEDKFVFYVENMCDPNRASTQRLYAYEKASALYSSCDPANVGKYMEMYDSLNIENDIEAPAKAANLAILSRYFDELKAYGAVTTANNVAISAAIEKIESFISNNSKYIDQTSDVFNSTNEYISVLREDITSIETLLNFISALKRFERATTLASKTKHYNSATVYYDNGELNLAANRAMYANDPEVLEFELLINGETLAGSDDYVTIFEYYDSCLENLGTQEMWENSKRIIDCVGFILNIEDYEHTEAVWEANYDYVNKYVTIIRDVIRSNNYSLAYPGIKEAIAEYEIINVYFYAILQKEHIDILEAQLVKYPTTNSYIEKLGICTFVDNYIAANDIDMTNEKLASIVLTNEVYKKELVIHREEYASLLEQNTVYFINIVNKMASYVDYKDIKPLYDEAIVYYYEMNVDSDAAKAAIALFENYTNVLEIQETASAMFLGYAAELKSAKNDKDIYLALVNCAAYVDDITENIDGVSDAFELYEKKLADYNAMIAPRNGEIEQVNDIVSAVRSGSIASAILAVINNIFNR